MADIIYKINNNELEYNLASSAYFTCLTEANNSTKIANLQGNSSNTFNGGIVPTGIIIRVKFTYSNTASNPTLNVNGSGAKSIKQYGATSVGITEATSWRAGSVITLMYDGSNWVIITGIDNDTTTDTKNTAGATNSTDTLHFVGSLERTANPQTYTSKEITMYNGSITSNMLQMSGEMYFSNGGSAIIMENNGLSLSCGGNVKSKNGITVKGNVYIDNSAAATKKWVREYVENNVEIEGPSGPLRVGFETDVYHSPGDYGNYDEIWHVDTIIEEEGSYWHDVWIVPYDWSSISGRHYLYVECDWTEPYFTCSGGVELVEYSGTGYNQVNFNLPSGDLTSEECWITVTAGGIEFTLYIYFEQDWYED